MNILTGLFNLYLLDLVIEFLLPVILELMSFQTEFPGQLGVDLFELRVVDKDPSQGIGRGTSSEYD